MLKILNFIKFRHRVLRKIRFKTASFLKGHSLHILYHNKPEILCHIIVDNYKNYIS